MIHNLRFYKRLFKHFIDSSFASPCIHRNVMTTILNLNSHSQQPSQLVTTAAIYCTLLQKVIKNHFSIQIKKIAHAISQE